MVADLPLLLSCWLCVKTDRRRRRPRCEKKNRKAKKSEKKDLDDLSSVVVEVRKCVFERNLRGLRGIFAFTSRQIIRRPERFRPYTSRLALADAYDRLFNLVRKKRGTSSNRRDVGS